MITTVVAMALSAVLAWFFGHSDGYAKGYDDATRRRGGGRIWR